MILTIPVLLAHILIIPIQNASKTVAAIVSGKVFFLTEKCVKMESKQILKGTKSTSV